VMFADMELMGIPHVVVIGDRNLDNNELEYKQRRSGEKQMIKSDDILSVLLANIKR
ncbi:MAG: His/Gly/Thr/Pro-type tRNA ligase C-terminal domain-containing protein, partial [Plesiomonas shigelloides]